MVLKLLLASAAVFALSSKPEKAPTLPSPKSALAEKSSKNEKVISFSDEDKAFLESFFEDFLKRRPELVMDALQRAMQKQQEAVRANIEKNAQAALPEIEKSGIILGEAKAPVQLFVFFDPLCPHCQDFEKILSTWFVKDKRKDVSVRLIPVSIMGADSLALSKVFIALSKKHPEMIYEFFEAKNAQDIFSLAKKAKLDVTPKDPEKDPEHKIIMENVMLGRKIGLTGVPAIFILKPGQQLVSFTGSLIDLESHIKGEKKGLKQENDKETSPAAVLEQKEKNKEEEKKVEAPASVPSPKAETNQEKDEKKKESGESEEETDDKDA